MPSHPSQPLHIKAHRKAKGFTLIELAIVLVIIGLIVGGVLVGRDLVSAATVRAQISQIEKYQQATNTFRSKYANFPGDIPDPDASKFGLVQRGAYQGQGDGNGIIEGSGANMANQNYGWTEYMGETALFWQDLSTFNLIDGSFSSLANGTSSFPNPTGSAVAKYIPAAKIGNNSFVYVWSGGPYQGGSNTNSNGINYFGFSAVSAINSANGCGGCIASTPSLTVAQAYAIDKKVDDGFPQTGAVTAVYLNAALAGGAGIAWAAGGGAQGTSDTSTTGGSATTCYDNGSTTGAKQQYSITQNNGAGTNCALSFKFQ